MTDPISDMLSRIRNAIIANHNEVVIPHSNVKSHIAFQPPSRRLVRELFIFDFEKKKLLYARALKEIKSTSLGIDHTFKSR